MGEYRHFYETPLNLRVDRIFGQQGKIVDGNWGSALVVQWSSIQWFHLPEAH